MKKEDRKVERLIRVFRKAKGLSQMELAERVGVSYQQIQKYEKGVNSLSVERLKQIAEALDLPATSFFPTETALASEEQASYGSLTDDEQRLLNTFRSIKDSKLKNTVLRFIEAAFGEKTAY